MASAAAAKKCPRPSKCWSPDQPQVRLVDEGGGIEGVAGRFVGQVARRKLAQLVVDQRQELLSSVRVSRVDGG